MYTKQHVATKFASILFFKILFIFRERGREGESERNINVWLPLARPPLGLACNPGMCPDWESNQRPFGPQPMLNPLSYTSQGISILFHQLQFDGIIHYKLCISKILQIMAILFRKRKLLSLLRIRSLE